MIMFKKEATKSSCLWRTVRTDRC